MIAESASKNRGSATRAPNAGTAKRKISASCLCLKGSSGKGYCLRAIGSDRLRRDQGRRIYRLSSHVRVEAEGSYRYKDGNASQYGCLHGPNRGGQSSRLQLAQLGSAAGEYDRQRRNPAA